MGGYTTESIATEVKMFRQRLAVALAVSSLQTNSMNSASERCKMLSPFNENLCDLWGNPAAKAHRPGAHCEAPANCMATCCNLLFGEGGE